MELITIHGTQLHFKTVVSLQVCHSGSLSTPLSCSPEKVGMYQKGINKK